jgi:hypothetical protein
MIEVDNKEHTLQVNCVRNKEVKQEANNIYFHEISNFKDNNSDNVGTRIITC